MTKKLLMVFFVLLFVLTSCADKKAQDQAKNTKAEKEEMTTEKYCTVYKDLDALMMEKYWPQFKGKEYAEVKDIYAEYDEEKKAIYEKYNVEYNDLASYFRSNFSAVEEYRKNDPDYKTYEEKQDAKTTIAGYAMKKGMGE